MFVLLIQYLADRVAMYKHAYTLYSAVRPFGCAVALGSYDEFDGPQLFMVDPSGVSFVRNFLKCSLNIKLTMPFLFFRDTWVAPWAKPNRPQKPKWKNSNSKT